MKTADFEFHLPERLVPSIPRELRGGRRDDARLAVLDRANEKIEHVRFHDLGSYLRAGDVLVVNNSLIVQDRLNGRCAEGQVALILFGQHKDGWHAIVRPAKRARRGRVVHIADDLRAVLVKPSVDDMWVVRFEHPGRFHELLEKYGQRHAPGLQRLRKRMETYRNVYASEPGSLEVPSAGLHFTAPLLRRIQEQGVEVAPITLHIGLSEKYRHIGAREVEDHEVGAEWYRVTSRAARVITRARRRRGRVVAVGTTVVRTLETIAGENSSSGVDPCEGWTDLFIYPGYRYRMVDAMLTNLHQPRSSHLMLVAAFAGKQFTLAAYREIVKKKYRFDLFGDSMLIL